jgi:hypothetical protein
MSIYIVPPDLSRVTPTLREPIVDGLFRRGEVVNWIASPKVGKTWMLYTLLLAVCTGAPWLGRKVKKGRVLLIDNELHPETGIQRLQKVARGVGADLEAVDRQMRVAWLRGVSAGFEEIEEAIRSEGKGAFDLIALDAFYRFIPKGTDENANGDMVQIYNHLDRIAAAAGASIINVHHASKGDQSQKGTTDVGSGAGAISRAVDTHIVYLRHAEEGCVTMRAVCRSFPPPDPVVLRVAPPTVTLEEELDPADLWTPRKARQEPRPIGAAEFVETFIDGTAGKVETISRATSHGIPRDRARGLLVEATALGMVETVLEPQPGAGRPKHVLRPRNRGGN